MISAAQAPVFDCDGIRGQTLINENDFFLKKSKFLLPVENGGIIFLAKRKPFKQCRADSFANVFEFVDGEGYACLSNIKKMLCSQSSQYRPHDIEGELHTDLGAECPDANILTTTIDDPELISRTNADTVQFYVFPRRVQLKGNCGGVPMDSVVQVKFPNCCGVVLRHRASGGDVCFKLFLSDRAFREREKYVKQAASMIRFKKKSLKY